MLRRCLLLLVALIAAGCAAKATPAVAPAQPREYPGLATIGELKTFEETLGEQATENFRSVSARPVADERCYFTGKLQLPESYSALRMVREDETRCDQRAVDDDVFFYSIQAVASGEETVTASLAGAPVERVLMVVPHEDFHNQPEVLKAPAEVAESAATLVGFLTASAFAREKFGEDSPQFQALAHDPEMFLRKALIVNKYYEQIRDLYGLFRAGSLTREQTLARKWELFDALHQECSAIAPDPASFNKCPAAMNNAGLAFDRTYTRNYPVMHGLYRLMGADTPALVATLKRLMPNWPVNVTDAGELIGVNHP